MATATLLIGGCQYSKTALLYKCKVIKQSLKEITIVKKQKTNHSIKRGKKYIKAPVYRIYLFIFCSMAVWERGTALCQ